MSTSVSVYLWVANKTSVVVFSPSHKNICVINAFFEGSLRRRDRLKTKARMGMGNTFMLFVYMRTKISAIYLYEI